MKTLSRGEELRQSKDWSELLPLEERGFIAAISRRHHVDPGIVAMSYYCGLTAPARIQMRRQQIRENDITPSSKLKLVQVMTDSILDFGKGN